MDQIHQREREIVEHIRGGDSGIELDGIEQQRFAVHECNVGEMKIAVTMPHESLPGAPREQHLDLRQMILAADMELIDGGGLKPTHGSEFHGVAVDYGRNGSEPGFAILARRPLV